MKTLDSQNTKRNSAETQGARVSTLPRTLMLVAAVAALLVTASAGAAETNEGTQGFIHGTVVTTSGQTFTGLLRWADEEAFWDDLFNSAKEDTPYLDQFGRKGDAKREFEVLGRKIKVDWGDFTGGRSFVTRFGDIRSITVLGGEEALLKMKDGSEIHIDGASNDVSSAISIRDAAMGDIEVAWKRIKTITFSATPAQVEPWGTRLHGVVTTDAGTFRGFIQWDKQECISIDKLDGEADDIKVSLKMGSIKSITRDGRRGSKVTLVDGRTMTVRGTNDVNDENRGILVEDQRYGRVEIPWMSFESVAFDPPGSSGLGYDAFQPRGRLVGTVRTVAGKSASGKIAFDLDEERDWEMLDGNADGISYSIPFQLITKVKPLNSKESEVMLRSGESLKLSGTQDVSSNNDGIAVDQDGKKTYVPWDEVLSVDFER